MKKNEISVDARGNTSLAGVRTQPHRYYLGTEEADGTIILVPAVLVPARRLQPVPEDPQPLRLALPESPW